VALAEEGERLGWSAEMLDKLQKVHARGIESLRIARAEGVPIVFGTDLLGHMHVRQSIEFELRRGAMSAVEVLQSATIVAARLMREEGRLGQIVPGAWADLILVDGDPTQELAMLADPQRGPLWVMKAGRVYRDRLQAA
jgi:imidazolonepropionase-like amidohydrolase